MYIWLVKALRIVTIESTLYMKNDGGDLLISILYIDDMLLISHNIGKFVDFEVDLRSAFTMSDMGLLHYYLGIQFMQNEKGIIMQQSKYLRLLLERFRLHNCKLVSIPMELGLKFSIYDGSAPFDATIYSQAMGCLIYLCNTKHDIQYAVSHVSRYMHSPKTQHWQVVKRVVRYLQGTKDYGLMFPQGSTLQLHAYSDLRLRW